MKFNIITLGCKVNTYESNVMSDLLKEKGFVEVKNDADIYIINTCTVTDTADSKTIKMINKLNNKYKDSIIIAVGCLVQIDKEKLANTNIDILIGNKNKTKIYDYIMEFKKTNEKIIDVFDISSSNFENMELNSSKKTRAFVKIQDGCNNYCSYCIIPYARGSVRSKKKDDVLLEVEKLLNLGHKEIVLTGIHTGSYGVDLNNYNLTDLLKDILKFEKLERIRISSIEITELTNEFLKLFEKEDKIVPHLHIPLQSGSDDILKSMNRKYDKSFFINKINEIKALKENVSITTDVIVGFPNESNDHFEETINTINEVGFTSLHVFPYSKRKNTKAYDMVGHIDEAIKKERVNKLLNISDELEDEYNKKFLNKTLSVIVETSKDGFAKGHTSNYLTVVFETKENLKNETVKVKIENYKNKKLYGVIV